MFVHEWSDWAYACEREKERNAEKRKEKELVNSATNEKGSVPVTASPSSKRRQAAREYIETLVAARLKIGSNNSSSDW